MTEPAKTRFPGYPANEDLNKGIGTDQNNDPGSSGVVELVSSTGLYFQGW